MGSALAMCAPWLDVHAAQFPRRCVGPYARCSRTFPRARRLCREIRPRCHENSALRSSLPPPSSRSRADPAVVLFPPPKTPPSAQHVALREIIPPTRQILILLLPHHTFCSPSSNNVSQLSPQSPVHSRFSINVWGGRHIESRTRGTERTRNLPREHRILGSHKHWEINEGRERLRLARGASAGPWARLSKYAV